MKLSIRFENGINIFELAGKLDSSNAQSFKDEFLNQLSADRLKVIINCAQLEFLSSAGIRIFYLASQKTKNFDTKIVFCNASENIQRVFEIIDFNSDFAVYNSLEEALNSLK
jgi:anti-anti-sigma factor